MTRSRPGTEGFDLRCALLAAATLLTAMLVACAGRADEERPFTIGPKPTWYLLAGVTTGGTNAHVAAPSPDAEIAVTPESNGK